MPNRLTLSRLFRRFFAALLLSLPAVIAPAADAPKVYTVGVEDYENFLPYSEYKNEVYGGLGRAILDAFARQQGIQFDYQVYPLARRDQMMVDGKFDFAYPDNPHWVENLKAGKRISYAAMLEYTDGVLVRPENKGLGLDQLKILGVPVGFTAYPYLKRVAQQAMEVTIVNDYDALYRMLALARVDGAYMNIHIARYYWLKIKKTDQVPLVYDPGLPHDSGYWYLSTLKHSQLIVAFKSFMENNPALIASLKKQYQFQPEDK